MTKRKSPGYGTFQRNVIPERIAERLIYLIQDNQLGPGDKLPPERELASMMQVSRSSLREALRALSILNIIEVRQGDGTYVSNLDIESLVQPLNYILTMDYPALVQLFEVRKILEIACIGLAAQRITQEELVQVEECLQRAIENQEDHQAFLQADIELHELIAEATRNPILTRFVVSLRVLGRASRERTVALPGVVAATVRDHTAMVEALKAKDPEAAKLAMALHLRHIEESLEHLERADQDSEAAEGFTENGG